MKTYRLIYILFGASILLLHKAAAQETSRMEKDIDVFEKVITQVFKQDGEYVSFPGNKSLASGTYVPGYGVIIQLPENRQQFFYPAPMPYNEETDINIDAVIEDALDQSREALKQANVEIEEANKQIKEANKQIKETNKQIKKGNKEVREYREFMVAPAPSTPPQGIAPIMVTPVPATPAQVNTMKIRVYRNDDSDSAMYKKYQFIMDKMKQALQNYGDLITQLAPGEKIVLVYDEQSASGNGSHSSYVVNGKEVTYPKVIVETKKEDIDALRNGKLTQAAFGEKIKANVVQGNNSDLMDYKIFAGILETVFDNSPETPFHVRKNINFTTLSGFGVIYHARMSSPYPSWDYDIFDTHTQPKETSEAKAKAQYMALGTTLKNYVLDYGRALRAVKDDQFILINIQLPENTSTPSKMSIKVKKEVLSNYDKGLLTREKALEAILVNNN